MEDKGAVLKGGCWKRRVVFWDDVQIVYTKVHGTAQIYDITVGSHKSYPEVQA